MPQYVYGLHDFEPENADEVPFRVGDRIEVLEKDDLYQDGWWTVSSLSLILLCFAQVLSFDLEHHSKSAHGTDEMGHYDYVACPSSLARPRHSNPPHSYPRHLRRHVFCFCIFRRGISHPLCLFGRGKCFGALAYLLHSGPGPLTSPVFPQPPPSSRCGHVPLNDAEADA